jgi:hypothetical protein
MHNRVPNGSSASAGSGVRSTEADGAREIRDANIGSLHPSEYRQGSMCMRSLTSFLLVAAAPVWFAAQDPTVPPAFKTRCSMASGSPCEG